jgi:hypothetical protein
MEPDCLMRKSNNDRQTTITSKKSVGVLDKQYIDRQFLRVAWVRRTQRVRGSGASVWENVLSSIFRIQAYLGSVLYVGMMLIQNVLSR